MKCNPSRNGFPGGMWTSKCVTEGQQADGSISANIPHLGFEGPCFKPGAILEKCLTEPGNSAEELLRMLSHAAMPR